MQRIWCVFLILALIVIAPTIRPANATIVPFSMNATVTWESSIDPFGANFNVTTEPSSTLTGTYDDSNLNGTGVEYLNMGAGGFATSTISWYLWDGGPHQMGSDLVYGYPRLYFTDAQITGLMYGQGVVGMSTNPSITPTMIYLNSNVVDGVGLSWRMYSTGTGGGDDYYGTWEVVSQVPLPGALWLLGSGLIGLVGIRRKIKN